MSESIFASIIEEWAERDWESYAYAPKFETSKKHDRAMRRIFKRYERNTQKLRQQSEIRARVVRKRIIVALVVIILAVFTGFTVAYFVTQSFRGEVHSDNTELFPIDTENCPMIIEDEYFLSEVPKEFEIISTSSDPFSKTAIYKNNQTGQSFTFSQWTKHEFNPIHFNTEKGKLVEVEINGHSGVFHDLSDENQNLTHVIWDNEDYILELSGDLPKNSLLDLAKSTKLFERSND